VVSTTDDSKGEGDMKRNEALSLGEAGDRVTGLPNVRRKWIAIAGDERTLTLRPANSLRPPPRCRVEPLDLGDLGDPLRRAAHRPGDALVAKLPQKREDRLSHALEEVQSRP
jgi:hypothetical protein